MSDLIMQKGVDDVLFLSLITIPYAIHTRTQTHTYYNIKSILNVNLPLKFMCVSISIRHTLLPLLLFCMHIVTVFWMQKGNVMRFHVRILLQQGELRIWIENYVRVYRTTTDKLKGDYSVHKYLMHIHTGIYVMRSVWEIWTIRPYSKGWMNTPTFSLVIENWHWFLIIHGSKPIFEFLNFLLEDSFLL